MTRHWSFYVLMTYAVICGVIAGRYIRLVVDGVCS